MLADLSELPRIVGAAGRNHFYRRRHAQPVFRRHHQPPAGRRARAGAGATGGGKIALEANPGTFEREKFEGFATPASPFIHRRAEFNDACLEKRPHPQQWRSTRRHRNRLALIRAGEHRFDVRPCPAKTLPVRWPTSARALATGVSHISAYHLTMEPNTPFGHTPPPDLPADEAAQDIEDAVQQALQEAGFIHYETSAFAKSSQLLRHNLNYWQFGDYLGIKRGRARQDFVSQPHRTPYANATPAVICKPSPPIPPRLPSAAGQP